MEDRLFDRAVKEFTEFQAKFPESPFKAEAIERALQATGESFLQREDYTNAAAALAKFQSTYTNSPRAVLAALGEANARLRLNDFSKTIAVLTDPKGAFQQALATNSPPEALFRGLFILAEARLRTQAPDAALETLDRAANLARTPSEQWSQQQLRVEVLTAANRIDAAIAAGEKLRDLSQNETLKAKRAESNEQLAQLYDRAGKADRARLTWEANLSTDIPIDARQRAAIRVAEFFLQSGDIQIARQRLEDFLRTSGSDGGGTRVRLMLGQTLFRQYMSLRGAKTNSVPLEVTALLTQATQQLDAVATNTTDTTTVPLAQLGRGWCLWEQAVIGLATNRFSEASEAFRIAAERLPHSIDQAIARFKHADCLLNLKQPALALTNYLLVSEHYKDLPKVQEELAEPALLQSALVATDLGNLDIANQAVERLLNLDSSGEEFQRSILLAGQTLARAGGGTQARNLFAQFSAKFPSSPLRADAQLAIAASFMREQSWTNAIVVLSPWVATYATNHAAAPRAEFDLAMALEQAGLATNSVVTFRNLVTKYPNHPLAQTALLLLGDRYSARGDFANAEQAFITIFTNTAWASTLAQQHAYLGAARAAHARGNSPTARDRLNTLINDPSCPTNLLAEAFFWLGTAWYDEVPEVRTNVVGNFTEAMKAFGKVERFASPNDERTPQAWCLIGQCALQIAAVDPKFYATANTNFLKTIRSPNADITWRSRAAVGLANVARRTGQPETALEYYQDVYYGKLRKPNEDLDPFYTWRAGLEACQLLEEQGRKTEAIRVCERLSEIFPSQKPLLEKRIQALKEAR